MSKRPTLRAVKPDQIKQKKAKIVLSGPAGVGKTTFACQFPNVHLIDAEGGATNPQYVAMLASANATYMGPDQGASDFPTVIEEVQALAMSQHDRKTLVIDSMSKLFLNAISEEEERLAAARKEVAFGNQKIPAVRMSRRLVTWLGKLDMNVILICHEKSQWQNGEQIGFTFDAWDKLSYELDLTIRMVKQGATRKGFVTKSRLVGFDDGSNFEMTYDEFARRYGRDKIEGDVCVLTPASAEQVAKLKTLVDVIKLDEATIVKWHEKAGVDRWEDMDADTAQACIDHLESKVRA